MAALACSSAAASRPVITTRAPSAANALAAARPMPLLPPVTRTVLLVKRFMVMSFDASSIAVSAYWRGASGFPCHNHDELVRRYRTCCQRTNWPCWKPSARAAACPGPPPGSGKAPSTVSHAARQLEARFDALLFDRRRYRLQLTPAGHLLAQEAARLMLDVSRSDAEGQAGGRRLGRSPLDRHGRNPRIRNVTARHSRIRRAEVWRDAAHYP